METNLLQQQAVLNNSKQSHEVVTDNAADSLIDGKFRHGLESSPCCTSIATHDSAPSEQIVKSVHIPYILNGQLYEIQTQDGENVTVRCCHCPPDRVYRGSVRSTGNFHMHIKRRHPDLLGKLHDMKVNALLERRDRLMKNRKFSYRGGGSRSNNKLHGPQPLGDTLPKLKIKSAFQRHQFQKQQQQQMQQLNQKQQNPSSQHHRQEEHHSLSPKWNIQPFVVPIGDSLSVANVHPEPINYSFKPDNPYLENQSPLSTFTAANTRYTTDQCPPVTNNNSINFDQASEATRSSVCSFGSNISVGNSYHNTITVVKDEPLMTNEAIDLTLQTSSISSGIGSSIQTTASTTDQSFTDNNAAGGITSNLKWNELLQQVENTLKEIQREMCTRNQIETNRIYLDIAKFKYLHPGFNFQC